MQVNLKNRDNDSTAHVTVRMNAREYSQLQTYMHAENKRLTFSHGVKLVYRGRGWYRLVTSRSYRAAEKLVQAIKVLRLFCNWRDAAVADACRVFAPVAGTAMRVIAYVEGEFVYAGSGEVQPAPPQPPSHSPPASASALSRLQQKFNHAQ